MPMPWPTKIEGQAEAATGHLRLAQLVELGRPHARPDGLDEQVVDLVHARVDAQGVAPLFAEGVYAEHVAAVVAMERANVHRDELTSLDLGVRRSEDDGAQGPDAHVDDVAVRVLVDHGPVNQGRQLQSRHALGQVSGGRRRGLAPPQRRHP